MFSHIFDFFFDYVYIKLKNYFLKLKSEKMVRGVGDIKNQKKPWKTKVERDIIMHEDLKESGLQGGKVIGNNLSLFSFIIGIPLLILGIYGLILLLGFGYDLYLANIILIILVFIIGALLTIGGYFIHRGN